MQYGVFERRLADKLSYTDWKLTLLEDEQEYKFMHQKWIDKANASYAVND